MEGIKHSGTEITMPHLAESLVSATIGKWLKKPGDYVQQYDVLCELITEKVNADMPSSVEGVLLEIYAQEGETVDVGSVICLIQEPEQSKAVHNSIDRSIVDVGQAATSAESTDQSMRHRYSPAVQRLAAQHGIDLSTLKGTGLGGRITRKDVLVAVENGAMATSTSASQTQQPINAMKMPVRSSGIHLSTGPELPNIEVEELADKSRNEYIIDVTPIRNTIATRMRQSVSEIPHAWTMIEVDVTNLVILRNKLKDEFKRKEGFNLTYLAFMLKAVVNAIKDYPIMNSVWAVDKILVKRDINISLAVGTEDSVISPVIKNADQKNIAGLAREIDELSRKARSGQLKLDEVLGGTITVNNTGSFGSILSYPIINYPQAANVTFESIVKKPVVIQDMIAVRSMVNLCLSLDHRILDGVICGRFLQRVKENLESYGPDTKLY